MGSTLRKRNINVNDSFSFCNCEKKDINPLFKFCQFVRISGQTLSNLSTIQKYGFC